MCSYSLSESLFSVERLMVFKRPPIYFVTHLILGIIGYYYPAVLYSTIGYQAFQYMFNFRFFLFQGEIKPGNTIEHTAIKLGEVGLGYLLAFLYERIYK
jgi:hypothetical protein